MVDSRDRDKTSHVGASRLAFGEIVGQDELKQALLAVTTDDALDGLLVRGEKGTAKSTAVRAVADLLPAQTAVADCPYGCHPTDPALQCADCRDRTAPPTVERAVPLVTLPLGATRERVVGTLSVADALDGDHEFDPGLLARAHRGILYVDEVNLLDDHLVDVVLDAAAGGVNRVERDGISVSHPAAFTLVGTMNPEEGSLRPQLRDRFALQATVSACTDLDRRVEILDRATDLTTGRQEDADDDPGSSTADETDSATAPGDRLERARDRIDDVVLPAEFARRIAELCRDAGIDGHRGDIATARAAAALAALDGRTTVIEGDVREAASLALPHRLESRPFEEGGDPDELVEDHFDDGSGEEEGGDGADTEAGDDATATDASDDAPHGTDDGDGQTREDTPGDGDDAGSDDAGEGGPDGDAPQSPTNADGLGSGADGGGTPESSGGDRTEADGDGEAGGTADDTDTNGGGDDEDGAGAGDSETDGRPLLPGESRAGVGQSDAPEIGAPEAETDVTADEGRSSARPGVDGDGPRVRTRPADDARRIDAAASVRAAGQRGGSSVRSRDLRQSVRRRETATLVLFVVDASASMRPAMRAAKGTVLELLKDAYRERDDVGVVGFAGDDAEVLLPPTDSVTLAARHLKDLPTGDRTPLPAGLRTAGDVLDRADPAASVVVLVTDGRANVAEGSPVAATREAARGLADRDADVLVVDAGDDRPGVAGIVADVTDGERVPLSALSADRVDAAAAAADPNEI